jgi:hypothetical protein
MTCKKPRMSKHALKGRNLATKVCPFWWYDRVRALARTCRCQMGCWSRYVVIYSRGHMLCTRPNGCTNGLSSLLVVRFCTKYPDWGGRIDPLTLRKPPYPCSSSQPESPHGGTKTWSSHWRQYRRPDDAAATSFPYRFWKSDADLISGPLIAILNNFAIHDFFGWLQSRFDFTYPQSRFGFSSLGFARNVM